MLGVGADVCCAGIFFSGVIVLGIGVCCDLFDGVDGVTGFKVIDCVMLLRTDDMV